MQKYEVTKDLEIADPEDPNFGSHTVGALIESEPSESIASFVEQGFLKLFEAAESALAGEPQEADTTHPDPIPPAEEEIQKPDTTVPPVELEAPAPTPGPSVAQQEADTTHPDNAALAARFPTPPAPFSDMLGMPYEFCMAVQRHEVYSAPGEDSRWPNGTRSFHDNNPGNLKYANQIGTTGEDKDSFAMFKDYDSGFRALYHQVEIAAKGQSARYKNPTYDTLKKIWRPMNLYDFFLVYDSSFGDNPKAYAEDVAADMSKAAGVEISPETPIGAMFA